MSLPLSIADTSLGLTSAELQLLRQQQHVLTQHALKAGSASRGRSIDGGLSQPSSRAASAASIHGQGRVFLDPDSLRLFNTHFEHLMRRIQSRLDTVSGIISFASISGANLRSASR